MRPSILTLAAALGLALAPLVGCGGDAPATSGGDATALVSRGEEVLRLAESTGDPDEITRAVELLDEAVGVDPDSPAARLALGRALMLADRSEDAVRHLDHATELDGANAAVFDALGQARLALGDLEGAIDALRTSIDRGRRTAPQLHAFGRALEQDGDVEAAITAYRDALAIEPTRAATHLRLSQLHDRRGEADASQAALAEFYRWTQITSERDAAAERAAAAPSDPTAQVAVAQLELDLGRSSDAAWWAQRALALDGSNYDALFVLGVARAVDGAMGESNGYFRRASEARADGGRALVTLAGFHARRGDATSARSVADEARERGASDFDVGLVLRDLGDADGALARFAAHVAKEPTHLDARLAAAALHYEAGRLDDAEREYEAVLAIDPSHEGARGSLEFVKSRIGDSSR